MSEPLDSSPAAVAAMVNELRQKAAGRADDARVGFGFDLTPERTLEGRAAALLAQVARERDEARRRTHEIQQAESRRNARLESDLAKCRNYMAAARGACLERVDPATRIVTHGDGRLGGISNFVQGVIAGLMERADAAERQLAEARAALEPLEEGYRNRCNYCHGETRYCDPRPECPAPKARALLSGETTRVENNQ